MDPTTKLTPFIVQTHRERIFKPRPVAGPAIRPEAAKGEESSANPAGANVAEANVAGANVLKSETLPPSLRAEGSLARLKTAFLSLFA